MADQCPKCGAKELDIDIYLCGSMEGCDGWEDGKDCLRRQLATAERRVAELEAVIEEVKEWHENYPRSSTLGLKDLERILSTAHEVLAVVEGYMHKSNIWYNDQLDMWPEWFNVGTDYIPVTVTVAERKEES